MSPGNFGEKVNSSQILASKGATIAQHQQASSSCHGHLSSLKKSLWNASMGESPPLLNKSDVLIGVIGMTGVGKTSFIEQITGLSMEIGHDLESCTKETQLATTEIGDHVVRFIDTPGFDDTDTKDSVILKTIWEYISIDLRLSGLLYLRRITDDRVGGTALKNLRMIQRLVGKDSMKNVILVTTMWDKLQPTENGEARVQQLTGTGKFWGGMMSSGATHERYDGTRVGAIRVVQMMLNNAPCMLQIQKEHDSGKTLADTAAGKEVFDRLENLRAHHAQEIGDMKEEISLAARKGNKKLQQELQALRKNELKLLQEIAEVQAKLQQTEIESLQARLAHLESKGGSVMH